MTTIVALADSVGGCTWIGSDSRITMGNNYIVPSASRKWARSTDGGLAIGSTGWNRGVQLVGERIQDIAASAAEAENAGRSVGRIADGIRDALRADDWRADGENGPYRIDISFIAVWRGKVYDIDGTFAPSAVTEGVLWARGSGMDFAIGAGMAAGDAGLSGLHRVDCALRAAAMFDAATAPPFDIDCIPWG